MARQSKQTTSSKQTTKQQAQAQSSENEIVAQSTVAQETTAQTNADLSMYDAFGQLLTELGNLRSHITTLTSQVRYLRTRSERELKAAQKTARKRKNPNRKPSGFVKPTLISTELASFLGKPKGTEMARTEVTKEINQYIRQHKLQDPQNGRRILADGKLRKLLKLGKTDELTYFNLQKFMSPHFAKASAATTSS